MRDGLAAVAKRSPGGLLGDPALLSPALLLWDGVCWLFSGKAKPSGWVTLLMKVSTRHQGRCQLKRHGAICGAVLAPHAWMVALRCRNCKG